jgi:flagellin
MPTIANNAAANSALFYLNRNSDLQSSSLAKISSGSRIVSASDDAGGLGVSEQLRADISALEVASRTTQQMEALLQVADGGLARVSDILQRMKALGTQFSSGTLDATSQGYINDEYAELVTEINLIETSTEYNGQNLLDGTYTGVISTAVVGANAADTINADLAAVNIDQATLTIPAAAFTTGGIAAELGTIDTAIGTVAGHRATVGGYISAFKFQGEVVDTAVANLKNANSTIRDVDIAAEQAAFTSYQVMTEAAISGLSQANEMKSSLLTLLR